MLKCVAKIQSMIKKITIIILIFLALIDGTLIARSSRSSFGHYRSYHSSGYSYRSFSSHHRSYRSSSSYHSRSICSYHSRRSNAHSHSKSNGGHTSYYHRSNYSNHIPTYTIGKTRYLSGERYKTTGLSKVVRSQTAKRQFLKSKGYTKTPRGYQIDHIIPLSQGGKDEPSNMQLLSTRDHQRKTANERKR